MQKILKKYFNLKKLSFLPTWSILLIDIFITSTIATLSFLIFKEIGVNFYTVFPVYVRFVAVIITYIFYFIIFKTYTGVIRYSSLRDATRLFKAISFSFFTLFLINLGYYFVKGQHVFVVMTLFFSSLFIFFSLVSFRILIKTLFKYLAGDEDESTRDNLAIIGVNSTTIALAEAFLNDSAPYRLRFFVDKNKYLNDKKVLGIPVVAKTNSISAILRYNKIKHVVLIKNFLPEKEELDLLDDCLRYKINVYNPRLVSGFDTAVYSLKSL